MDMAVTERPQQIGDLRSHLGLVLDNEGGVTCGHRRHSSELACSMGSTSLTMVPSFLRLSIDSVPR